MNIFKNILIKCALFFFVLAGAVFLFSPPVHASHLKTIDTGVPLTDTAPGQYGTFSAKRIPYNIYDSDINRNILVAYDPTLKKIFLYKVSDTGIVEDKKEVFAYNAINVAPDYPLMGIVKGHYSYFVTYVYKYYNNSTWEWYISYKLYGLDASGKFIEGGGFEFMFHAEVTYLKPLYNSVDKRFDIFFEIPDKTTEFQSITPVRDTFYQVAEIPEEGGGALSLPNIDFSTVLNFTTPIGEPLALSQSFDVVYNSIDNQYAILYAQSCNCMNIDPAFDAPVLVSIISNTGKVLNVNQMYEPMTPDKYSILGGQLLFNKLLDKYYIIWKNNMPPPGVISYEIVMEMLDKNGVRMTGGNGIAFDQFLGNNDIFFAAIDYIHSKIGIVTITQTRPLGVGYIDSVSVQTVDFNGFSGFSPNLNIPIFLPADGMPTIGLAMTYNATGKFFISYVGADHDYDVYKKNKKLLACIEAICRPDFTLNVTPLNNVANPGWSEDYSISITRQAGLDNVVSFTASVTVGTASDLSITWPDGDYITAGDSGPIRMRVQALDPPTESKRGTDYMLFIKGRSGLIAHDKNVKLHINQRPVARFSSNKTSLNVGGNGKVSFTDSGSRDWDIFAPGNIVVLLAADFNGDGVIDKCFDSSRTVGCTDPDPRLPGNKWDFTYDTSAPRGYLAQYIACDDLIKDPQVGGDINQLLKSCGAAMPMPIVVGSDAPPTLPLNLLNEDGGLLSAAGLGHAALPGQTFFANVNGASDPDGTISKVGFCIDTTPNNDTCDGNWTLFDWNTSDLQKGWLAVAKRLRLKIYTPGRYGIYALAIDNSGSMSEINKDALTILAPTPPVADNQSITTNEDTPAPITLTGSQKNTGVVSIDSLLTLKSDGTVWTWGNNDVGQVGTGSLGGNILIPSQVNSKDNIFASLKILDNAVKISAGWWHNLALKSDGTVWAWGKNDKGQLGDGTATDRPFALPVFNNAINISAGSDQSLAIDVDGNVWGWGINSYYNLCDSVAMGTKALTPVKFSTINNVVDIATAYSFTSLFLKSDGTVWRCGENVGGVGPLAKTPEQISGFNNIVSIKGVGGGHFLALKSDGTVWAWGENGHGQLGDNQSCGLRCSTPVQASGLNNVVAITAGPDSSSLALKSDGTVWAWGKNDKGQLGDGTTIDRLAPVQISSLGISTIDITYQHSLNSNSTVFSWGDNSYGELGNNTITPGTPSLVPVQAQFPFPNLMYKLTSLPTNGILKDSLGNPLTTYYITLPYSLGTNPNMTYYPDPNYNGLDEFNFLVNDAVQNSPTATVSLTITPVNDAPVAAFTVMPLSGVLGTTVFSVDASGSYDIEDGANIFIKWDWGDGAQDNCATLPCAKTASHTYKTPTLPGPKTITLTVTDSGGLTGTTTQTVTVTAPIPPTPHNISVTNPGTTGKITSTSTQVGATNFDCGNGGSICGPLSYNGGEKITFHATPNGTQKYSDGTWGGACSGSTSIDCTLTVSADATISAAFTAPRSLSVTIAGSGTGSVTSSPGSINCPGTCSDTYTNGAVVTLTAVPVNSTVAWAGCTPSGLTCAVTMNANTSVTATFTPNPPLAPTALSGTPTCVINWPTSANTAAVNLSWTDNATNEAGFEIQRDTAAGFPSPAVIIVNPNTVANPSITGLVSSTDTTSSLSTKYYYRVRAFNDGGNSAFSPVITITTDSCAPTFRIFDSSGDTTASINVGGTEQYTAKYDADGPGGPALETDVTSSTAWSATPAGIATIDTRGLATGAGPGTVTITGSYNFLSATASLEVRGDINASFTASPSSFIKSPYKSTLSATILPPYIGSGDYTYTFDCGNGHTKSDTISGTADSYDCTYTISQGRSYTASVVITRAVGANQFSDSKAISIKPPLPSFKEKIPK